MNLSQYLMFNDEDDDDSVQELEKSQLQIDKIYDSLVKSPKKKQEDKEIDWEPIRLQEELKSKVELNPTLQSVFKSHISLKGHDLYQPGKVPPNWEEAHHHRQAMKVGKEHLELGHAKICFCCARQSNKKVLSLGVQPESLAFLGIGYPLFFQFIKSCGLVLMVIFFLYSQYNLFTNVTSHDCVPQQQLIDNLKQLENKKISKSQLDIEKNNLIVSTCVQSFITRYSFANKRYQKMEVEFGSILDISSCLALISVIVLIRKIQYELIETCDRQQFFNVRNITYSDYTILVTNIPMGVNGMDYERALEEYFEGYQMQLKEYIEVTEINFPFTLEYYKKIESQLHKLIEEKVDLYKKLKKDPKQFNLISNTTLEGIMDEKQKNIDFKRDQLFKIQNEYSQKFDKEFIGTALVSFQTEHCKKKYLEKFCIMKAHELSMKDQILYYLHPQGFNRGTHLFNNTHRLKVVEAPEPQNINWLQLDLSKYRHYKRIFYTVLYYIAIFFMCFFVYKLIYFQQNFVVTRLQEIQTDNYINHTLIIKQITNWDFIKFELLNVMFTFIIVIVNSFVISYITKIYCDHMKPFTDSGIKILCARNLAFVLFVNQSLIVLLAVYFGKQNYFGPGGLIDTQFYVFIFDFSQPLLNLILDPQLQIKRFSYWYNRRLGENSNLPQKDANKLKYYFRLAEMPPHQIDVQSALLLKTVYNSVFYAPILPGGVLITIAFLVLFYWSEKYLIIKERCVNNNVDANMGKHLSSALELVIVLLPLGGYLKNMVFNESLIISNISMTIALVFYMIPVKLITEEFILDFEDNAEATPFDKAKKQFEFSYSICNPIQSRYHVNQKVTRFQKEHDLI